MLSHFSSSHLFKAAFLLIVVSASIVWGTDRTLPAPSYFGSFTPYYSAEYSDSLRFFRDAARDGLVTVDGRWVDSICYFTMMGECYYQLGDVARAVEQYDAAVKLYLAYPDWMLKVDFPAALTPSHAGDPARITWGKSARASQLGHFPTRMSVMMGRLDNDRVIRQGGVVDPPQYRPLVVQEIVRCTALAIRRRHELLGPACKYDPLTDQLVAALSRRPAPPNHWSQAWIDVQLGLAYASADRPADALAALQGGILAANQYDHPLTATALLEIGHLLFDQGKYEAAATMYFEATFAAAQFDHLDELEEAFRYAAITHVVSGQKGVYPPLANAMQWSRTRGSRLLQMSLAMSAAECSTAQGQHAAAATFLDQAQRAMLRNDLAASSAGARFNYLTAQVNFQRGNVVGGNSSLAAALAHLKNSSRRLYQIGLSDNLYTGGSISPRVAENLFAEVLRDPDAKDWILHPLESLAVSTTAYPLAMEHYFELMLGARKDAETAITISDQIRRRRFYSTLPLGGRLLALRWILEAPEEVLSQDAKLQRQNFLVKYPAYAERSQQAAKAHAALSKMPLVPADPGVADKQAKAFTQLAALSTAQEAMLGDISLRREASDYSFPPVDDLKSIQERMPDGQLTVAFFNTTRAVYMFLISNDSHALQVINQPTEVRKQLASMLRAMGLYDRNQVLLVKNLEDDTWQHHAQRLSDLLLGGVKPEVWDHFDELVIVPDGILWYLPFEVLPVPDSKTPMRLISKFPIRYAPTVSTTLPDQRGHQRLGNTAVVTGKMFPRDDELPAAVAFQDMQREIPGAVRLPVRQALPTSSSQFSSLCDTLVVLDEVEDGAEGPYGWSPMQIDRGRSGSTLGDWLKLPWAAPQHVVIPGFQTAAAEALKNGGSGDEIFVSVCAMMAGGTRSILLSRWRTAGQTCFDLTREFVQQLSTTPADRAWQRSVHLTMATELIPELEPRLNGAGAAVPLRADHPFFWSGYLLIDTGSSP